MTDESSLTERTTRTYTEQPREVSGVDRIGGIVSIGIFVVCVVLLVWFIRCQR